MAGPVIDILMYHSIADADGPTSVSPAVFADQMAALAASDVAVITLDDLVAARTYGAELPERAAIITFDDGFTDFAEAAWPEMKRHGFCPIVYVPSAHVGRAEDWVGAAPPPRPLMDWDVLRQLQREGVQFGSHSVSHPDLTQLSDLALQGELTRSKSDLEDGLGTAIEHFAPPYGLAKAREINAISQLYKTSVGTRLGQAGSQAPIHDLPRLEMFYFTDIDRWRAHLAGQGAPYLMARKSLRALGKLVQKPWQ